jgi:hypothetical protein
VLPAVAVSTAQTMHLTLATDTIDPPVSPTYLGGLTFTPLTQRTAASLPAVNFLARLCSNYCAVQLSHPYPDEVATVTMSIDPLETGDMDLIFAESVFSGPEFEAAAANCTVTNAGIPITWPMSYTAATRTFTINQPDDATEAGPLVVTCPGVHMSSRVIAARSFISISVSGIENVYDAMSVAPITARPAASSLTFSAPAGLASDLVFVMQRSPAFPALYHTRVIAVPLPVATGTQPLSMGIVCSMQVGSDPAVMLAEPMVRHLSPHTSELLLPLPAANIDALSTLTFTCSGFVTPAATALPYSYVGVGNYRLGQSPTRYTLTYPLPAPSVNIPSGGVPTGSYLAALVPHSHKATATSGTARVVLNPVSLTLPRGSQLVVSLPPAWNIPSTDADGSASRCKLTVDAVDVAGTTFARRLWDSRDGLPGRNTDVWRTLRFVTGAAVEATASSLVLTCDTVAVPTVATDAETGVLTLLGPDGNLMLYSDQLRLPQIFLDQEGAPVVAHTLYVATSTPLLSAQLDTLTAAYRAAIVAAHPTLDPTVTVADQRVSGTVQIDLETTFAAAEAVDAAVLLVKMRDSLHASAQTAGLALSSSSVGTPAVEYRVAECFNERKTRLETDTDCGGIECRACSRGQLCDSDADCATTACYSGRCVDYGTSAAHAAGISGLVAGLLLLAVAALT